MTLKHIKFYDSPVMRELERQAVTKGTFKSNSVEDLVKKASVKKSFVPTGDLQTDLLNLAAGLRERGFVKEADDLEDKIFIKKQAETHLYRAIDEDGEDLLDFAHPEGDAKVQDAQNQEGVVETILSQHEKMKDVATKQPTGKYAKLIDSIILATAEALDVDLIKMAKLSDEDEELLTGVPGKKKATIQAANQFIKENSAKIVALLKDGIGEFHPENWAFKEEALIAPENEELRNKYASLVGIKNPKDILAWNDKVKTFGAGENRFSTISSTIMSMSKTGGLVAWADKAAAGLGAKYFSGSQPSKDKETVRNNQEQIFDDNFRKGTLFSPFFKDNPESIWLFKLETGWDGNYHFDYPIDSNKVAEAAKAIDQSLTTFHDSILGADKLAAASTAFANEGKVYFDALEKVAAFYDAAPEISEDATSFLNVVQPFAEMPDHLKKFVAGGEYAKNLAKLIKSGGWQWEPKAFSAVAEAIKINNTITNYLNKNALSSGDAIINDDTAADLFKNTAKMYYTAIPNMKDKAKAKEYEGYMMSTLELFHLLDGAKGRPFSEIADKVKKMYPKATSYDKLVQEAQTWANESAAMTGQQVRTTSSTKQGITKKASPPGQSAKYAPGVQSPGQGGTGQGGAKASNNVKLMQDAMNSLGQYLEQTGGVDRSELMKLRNSGQGPNTTSGDGVWGSRTTTALQTAKDLFKVNLVTNMNPATADRDAQNNYAILQQVLRSYNRGGGAADGTVLDKLPQTINWNGMPEEATYEGGQLPVTVGDLSTLARYYNFLMKNRLVQKTTSGASEVNIGREGIALGDLSRSINWFVRRAVFKYNSVKDQEGFEDAKNKAKLYYQKANGLMSQYSSMLRSINPALSGLDAQGIDRYVITGESLQQIGANQGAAGGRDAGSTHQQDVKGRRQRGMGPGGFDGGAGGGGMEGTKTHMPGQVAEDNSPPITDIVDLSRTDWFDLPYDNLESPRLMLSQFQRIPGPRMAQAMFSSDAMDDAKSQKQVLDFMGFTPYILGWNKDLNSYVVRSRDGGRVSAQDLPGFKETMGQVMARSSTQQYQQFLNQLSKQLHDVYSSWSQSVSAGEDAAMKDYYTRWQQAITKQYRDITKRRG